MSNATLELSVAYRITLPDGRSSTHEVKGATIRLGRDPACEIAIDPVLCPSVSSLHASVEFADGHVAIVHRSQSNKTLLNDAVVETTNRVKPGDRLKLGYTGPVIELLSLQSAEADDPAGKTIQANERHLALFRGTLGAQRIDIGRGGVIGRGSECQFRLEHPHVSRNHAGLAVDGDLVAIADLGSSNGTFVNGERIRRPTRLTSGDRIEIGPFSLRFDGSGLVSHSRSNNIELSARGVRRVVPDRGTGNARLLLEDVTLVIRPREFVCVLGPSGSGKSTLLAILSGRHLPDGGSVLVNGENLYVKFEALTGDIAVVPQRDLLHASLEVGAALRYTAELRLPPDTSANEIDAHVSDILEIVGLSDRRDTQIRHLSGGQVKRASLANELMSRPSLLFLDEVTSGLDEETDRAIMDLFRQIADGGKTVVCITHNLANVEATCHLVVILTRQGSLAFVGTPDEARAYFDMHRLGDVYSKLEERLPQEWQSRFRAHRLYQKYVVERVSVGPLASDGPYGRPRRTASARSNGFRQSWVLIRRYAAILRGDPRALLAMAGQGLLIAVLLALVFGRLSAVANSLERAQRTVNLQLLLAVSCFWFGCNTAAKELVKERTIFHRERAMNLRIDAYLASKFTILTAVSVLQVSLLWGIVQARCGIPGSPASQWLTFVVLSIAGTAIGLLISTVARTEELATALVPMVVIPQIIMAGVIAPLSGAARGMAKSSITVYWAQQALERLLPSADRNLLQTSSADWRLPLGIVLSHCLIAAIGSLILLRAADE
jgi:ABC transport system ATP-binding/permease protein